ncbi:MAG TPA: YggS family pyridoxal phosphate-dependent enzyme [Candidatus Krumholzibacteria bacterium]|nr:YggS family pyridoxal phosphate-dependent enzyme [Candidatus Krumholzibacteria bacterium]
MDPIPGNVERVRSRVAEALSRCGRALDAVTVVAVTKTFSTDVVRRVIRAGIHDIGENRVQELTAKAQTVSESCRWHLVGPLQRNKARKVVGLVHLIHAVDGLAVAQTVDRIAREQGIRARVLLEVNMSGEASKHGVEPADAPRLADEMASLDALEWRGLMTIGPLGNDPAATRDCFRRLATLAAALRGQTGLPLPDLSMGMSDDFEIAIEEGATLIRLGRIITGDRR